MRLSICFLLLAACTDDSAGPPAAPTNLAVASVAGGGHLTWMDNSDDEERFVVMRRASTTTELGEIASVPSNGRQYHDMSTAAGMTYVYKIVAINAAGEAASNEVTFTP